MHSIRVFCFFVVLLCSTSCQHYIIKSNSVSGFDKIKSANYKIRTLTEAESDPRPLHLEQNIVFKDVSEERKKDFKKAFSKALEKVVGKNDGKGEEIVVDAKINRMVLCEFGHRFSTMSGAYGYSLSYWQTGSVVLNLTGLSKENKEVFKVDIEYDMNNTLSSVIKSLACDSFEKVTGIINEKILPLAVQEIGQNRVIDKL